MIICIQHTYIQWLRSYLSDFEKERNQRSSNRRLEDCGLLVFTFDALFEGCW